MNDTRKNIQKNIIEVLFFRGFFPEIFKSYFDLKASFFSQLAKCKSEARLLAYGFTISILLFFERLPGKVVSHTSEGFQRPLLPAIGIDLFASIFFVPLFLYLASAIFHLALLSFRGKASFFESRLAFFWSIIVCAPILLIFSLVESFSPDIFPFNVFKYITVLLSAWIFSSLLCAAEGFSSHLPLFFSLLVSYLFLLSLIT